MYHGSHFSDFLSDGQVRKQSAMSCHHVSDRSLSLHPLISSSLSSVSTSCPISSLSLFCSSSSTWSELPSNKSPVHPQNEEHVLVAIQNHVTGYELKQLDDFDYSETSAMIFQDESGDIDTEPSYSFDAELDDELIRKALSSPLFTQEREEPANMRQTYRSHEESVFPAQSFFRTYKYGETRVRTKFRFVSKNGNQVATWKTTESGFSLTDKKANSRRSQNRDPEARTSSRF